MRFLSACNSLGLTFFVGGLLLAGCSSLGPGRAQINTQPTAYQTLQISYRVVEAPAKPNTPVKVATLAIKYPHPMGKPGTALAEMVIEKLPGQADTQQAAGRWQQIWGGVESASAQLPGVDMDPSVLEAWAMDVPLSEVDGWARGLNDAGFFGSDPAPPAGNCELAIDINGQRTAKPWKSVPELNRLAKRIRREGTVVSYRRPPGTTPGATLLAQQKVPSPGAMPSWTPGVPSTAATNAAATNAAANPAGQSTAPTAPVVPAQYESAVPGEIAAETGAPEVKAGSAQTGAAESPAAAASATGNRPADAPAATSPSESRAARRERSALFGARTPWAR